MAQLYKVCKTIFRFSANSILFAVLFAFNPAFGVIGDPTVTEIPPSAFSELHGIKKPKSPVIIKLDGNKVDLSPVMQVLEQVKKSHYDNYSGVSSVWTHVYWTAGRDLCDTFPKKGNIREKCRDEMQETIRTFKKNMEEEMSERILYEYYYKPKKELYNWFNNLKNKVIKIQLLTESKKNIALLQVYSDTVIVC